MFLSPARLALVASLTLAATALGCGAAPDGSPTPTGGKPAPTGTTPGATPPPASDKAADPIADPVPSDLPTLMAHATDSDVAPDLSCAGKPLPVASAPLVDKEFHLVSLGGTDSDRVSGLDVQFFFNNTLGGTADLTEKSGMGEGEKSGVFKAKAPSGFVAFHVPASTGYVETSALDFDLRGDGPFLPTAAATDRVAALSALISNSATYVPLQGAGRVVVRVVDCADRPLAGAHVALEVDGVVTAIAATSHDSGVRRSYFGDGEFPGTGKWTSRSGVVGFLDVPASKTIRVVARGNETAGGATVIAMRSVPVVVDGVLTAKVTPYSTAK